MLVSLYTVGSLPQSREKVLASILESVPGGVAVKQEVGEVVWCYAATPHRYPTLPASTPTVDERIAGASPVRPQAAAARGVGETSALLTDLADLPSRGIIIGTEVWQVGGEAPLPPWTSRKGSR